MFSWKSTAFHYPRKDVQLLKPTRCVINIGKNCSGVDTQPLSTVGLKIVFVFRYYTSVNEYAI